MEPGIELKTEKQVKRRIQNLRRQQKMLTITMQEYWQIKGGIEQLEWWLRMVE